MVDAGAKTVSGITYYYKAFGVAWMFVPTSVGDWAKNDDLIVYPNPTPGILKIIVSENQPVNRVEVCNMQGQK